MMKLSRWLLVVAWTFYTVQCEDDATADDAPPDDDSDDNRIIGGSDAVLGQFPSSVSFQYRNGQHFCGGTLLDMKHILSAAHCFVSVTYVTKSTTSIQAMGNDLSVAIYPVGDTRQVRLIAKLFNHPQYNTTTHVHDIAVVRLQEAFIQTGTFHPIAVSTHTPPDGTVCVVTGWGTTSFKGKISTELKYVVVSVISKTVCNARKSYNGRVPKQHICAGTMAGGKDSCQGDSGGGLLCENVLSAVVSYGVACAKKNFPGLYTDVAYYKSFIENIVPPPPPKIQKDSISSRLAPDVVLVWLMVLCVV